MTKTEKKIEKKLDLVVEDGIQKLTVTITEDGKENVETFEGDEVDQYFERDGVHRFKVKDGDKKHMLMFLSEDGNEFEFGGEKNIDVKVEVSDKGGEKKVTVTKTVDGKVVVEEYVGEKADEFMEKHDNKKFNVKVKKIGHHNGSLIVVDEDNLDLDIDIDCDDDEMIWVTSGDTNKIMKKKLVKVTEEDGVKKVTVTTTENGEKKVETYEGEKAEQFLKELEEKDSADGDSGKKIKKKIIKKIK
ncbi:MAG: hypothetical protein KJ799_18085 [Bacteroidetes bacterium]|nr:hypothetical protein [Bacteroidota bacterium]